jgi:hypothetical protein
MVRGWALVAVATGIFAYATGMSSAASTSRASRCKCPPHGAHVIAQDRVVRVYSISTRSSHAYAVRACRRGTSASVTLLPKHSLSPHVSVGQFVLAGDFVGYTETQFGVDSGSSTLIVVDVASRRTAHEISAGHYVDAGLLFSERVTDFVVSNRGSLAWITVRRSSLVEEERTVQVVGPTGTTTIADSNTTIDPTSLRLADHTLSWSDGGAQRTAPMP